MSAIFNCYKCNDTGYVQWSAIAYDPCSCKVGTEIVSLPPINPRTLTLPDLNANTAKLKIKRLHADAVIPSYAKPGDAGLDLTVIDDGVNVWANKPNKVFYYREYSTGLAFEIPQGFVGLIFPRSSQSNTGLILANCVGVIDSGYRGEVKFRFKVDAASNVLGGAVGLKAYAKGERAGQLIVMPIPTMIIEEVTELSDTDRGDSGFGSSGA